MSAPPFSYSRVGRSRPAVLIALAAAASLVTAFTAPVATAATTITGDVAAAPAQRLPYENASLPITTRVADLLGADDAGREGRADDADRARPGL